MSKIIAFIKKEIVLCISVILACVSCFFVKPSAQYLNYIDTGTLCMLFSFMAVVAGLRECGVFEFCARVLSQKAPNVRILSVCMVFLNFFFSMFITNDVALLTFVPFTILLFKKINQTKYLLYVIVIETIAANLGSMLTPMGNPQNMFLYTVTKMNALEFILVYLPYVILSAVLLFFACCTVPEEKLNILPSKATVEKSNVKLASYLILFGFCILTVFTPVPAWVLAIAVAATVAVVQPKILLKVDYMLLLTFVAFFIFSGNMQNIPAIKNGLEKIVAGHEFWTGLLASQVISNVPATLLLYNFCQAPKELMLGVDFGGLGTLVASLATLISYKLYSNSKEEGDQQYVVHGGKFISTFTVMSILFLTVLIGAKYLLALLVN